MPLWLVTAAAPYEWSVRVVVMLLTLAAIDVAGSLDRATTVAIARTTTHGVSALVLLVASRPKLAVVLASSG